MHHPKGGLKVDNQTQRARSPQARKGSGLRRLIRGSTVQVPVKRLFHQSDAVL